jgi:hypothetical protein|tara:strand:+ start:109 stop:282 length:174 start_codon:yes stop_codon:yes gene_type:complete
MKFSKLGVNICFHFLGSKTVWNKIDDARCIQLHSAEQKVLPAICPDRDAKVFALKQK